MSRRKTVQEKRAELPDDGVIGSGKKRVAKLFLVQHRRILPKDGDPDCQFQWMYEWRGDKKFANRELAEAYVKKQKRCISLARYEWQILDLREA